jgi:hypothetical protein
LFPWCLPEKKKEQSTKKKKKKKKLMDMFMLGKGICSTGGPPSIQCCMQSMS